MYAVAESASNLVHFYSQRKLFIIYVAKNSKNKLWLFWEDGQIKIIFSMSGFPETTRYLYAAYSEVESR